LHLVFLFVILSRTLFVILSRVSDEESHPCLQ
jgi:hypothetical protein